MKFFKTTLIIIFSITLSNSVLAQEQEESKLSLNEGTLDNQFEYVIQRSNNYQEYKVVKKTWLYALKAHTMDSLKAIRENLNKTMATVDTQANEISELKNNLANTQNSLDSVNKEKDSMVFLGMQMSKAGYSTLLWSIIGGLLALLLFFIYKFKNSNSITRQAKKALAETEEEFEEHRKTALEREQKVRRQLQDEINKQKNDS